MSAKASDFEGRTGAREAALRALVRWEKDEAYLNLLLAPLLKSIPENERPLARELACGTVRRLNTIDWALERFSNRPLCSYTTWVRNILRSGAYQLLYLDRVPSYAAVDQSVGLARRFGHRGVARLVNALLRRLDREKENLPWPDQDKEPALYLSLVESMPLWLVKRTIGRFGFEEAGSWCRANNLKALPSLRPNRLRTTPGELVALLHREGFGAAPSPAVPEMLRLDGFAAPAESPSFRAGLFTFQGESSALVAPLLGAVPGETIIDTCSAPGGKTTHLAELIGDRGRVIAVDRSEARLALVRGAARRLGLESVQALAADGRSLGGRVFNPPPDAALVDAPCSGLGVIRRLPEIKWRRSGEELPALQKLQLELLRSAASTLTPGGRLVYSVCSTEPEETTEVIEAFRRAEPGFAQVPLENPVPLLQGSPESPGPVTIWPHRHGLDGFFIALWRKRG